jgi:hypothetical protein
MKDKGQMFSQLEDKMWKTDNGIPYNIIFVR